jgi:tRNA pseudouridine38-40 synthase
MILGAIRLATGEKAVLHGSGRTDAGVHALRQAANFWTSSQIPADRFPYALNTRLPRDIRVMGAQEAGEGFHARYSCTGKEYSYAIDPSPIQSPLLYKRAWHFPHSLDLGRMRECAGLLAGERDFRAFMSTGSSQKTTVRSLRELAVEEKSGLVVIRASANGFLYNMVRILAGTLAYAGTGRLSLDSVAEALSNGDRKKAGPTAPACGLCLVDVKYGGIA